MNSIWNDPDFVVRAGRVWETVVSFLIEMDSLFPKELAVAQVTHHCTVSEYDLQPSINSFEGQKRVR